MVNNEEIMSKKVPVEPTEETVGNSDELNASKESDPSAALEPGASVNKQDKLDDNARQSEALLPVQRCLKNSSVPPKQRRRRGKDPLLLERGVYCDSCRIHLPPRLTIRRHDAMVHKPRRQVAYSNVLRK